MNRQHGEVGQLGDRDIKLGALLPDPHEVLVPRARVDDEPEPGVGEEVDDEIVENTACLIEHAGIQCLAGTFELRDIVREQVLEKFADPRAFEIDRAHVGDIEHTGRAANGVVLR